jgi:hypothetical protein
LPRKILILVKKLQRHLGDGFRAFLALFCTLETSTVLIYDCRF